jgi:Flp pilus assembly protein TadG
MHVALQRFVHDQDGNLTPMFALTLLPVLGLIGMTVDYSQSSARKVMLDSIADSASLAAVTPAMLHRATRSPSTPPPPGSTARRRSSKASARSRSM